MRARVNLSTEASGYRLGVRRPQRPRQERQVFRSSTRRFQAAVLALSPSDSQPSSQASERPYSRGHSVPEPLDCVMVARDLDVSVCVTAHGEEEQLARRPGDLCLAFRAARDLNALISEASEYDSRGRRRRGPQRDEP